VQSLAVDPKIARSNKPVTSRCDARNASRSKKAPSGEILAHRSDETPRKQVPFLEN